MADLAENQSPASAWNLLRGILTALAYIFGIVLAVVIVLALAFAILWFAMQYGDFLRRYIPGI